MNLTKKERRAIRDVCQRIAAAPDTWVQDKEDGQYYPAHAYCTGETAVWIDGYPEFFGPDRFDQLFRFRAPALVA